MRKQWLLIALAVLLGGISRYLNQDWFTKDNIHIYHRSRPARMGLFRRNKRPANTQADRRTSARTAPSAWAIAFGMRMGWAYAMI